jgi:predicted transcriptional regulator of viral defense system
VRTARGLPPALLGRDNAVVRPRDAAGVYVNPHAEFRRLVGNGLLVHLAEGYYAVVPPRWVGRSWRPDLDAVALGLAQADYGRDRVALTHLSAARHHGAIPRALAAATVAAPVQRSPLRIGDGTLHFAKRPVDRLEVEAIQTDVTRGWVTTREQTLLDLAARPTYGGISRAQAEDAIRAIAEGADWERVDVLAAPQRKKLAAAFARSLAEGAGCSTTASS